MGLFGNRGTRSTTGSSHVIGFLDETDDAYMLAFDPKDIEPFAPHADPAVCTAVLQEILSGEDRYFGISKLGKRSWEIALDDGRTVRVVKHVDHEATNCDHGLSTPLGDQVLQEWDMSADEVRQFRVIRIKRTSNDQ